VSARSSNDDFLPRLARLLCLGDGGGDSVFCFLAVVCCLVWILLIGPVLGVGLLEGFLPWMSVGLTGMGFAGVLFWSFESSFELTR
jgi:hypothetical protein